MSDKMGIPVQYGSPTRNEYYRVTNVEIRSKKETLKSFFSAPKSFANSRFWALLKIAALSLCVCLFSSSASLSIYSGARDARCQHKWANKNKINRFTHKYKSLSLTQHNELLCIFVNHSWRIQWNEVFLRIFFLFFSSPLARHFISSVSIRYML